MDKDQVRAYWDAHAEEFDDAVDHGLTTTAARSAWWAVLRDKLPEVPARVADLGCGTGSLSVLLANRGYEVLGIDLSPEMLRRARQKAAVQRLSIDFSLGDASNPPLHTQSQNVVLARHLLWALPDPASALTRWAKLVTPGGQLILIEGRWSDGAGLTAEALANLVLPISSDTHVQYLNDPKLWGKPIEDERYAMVVQL